MYMYMYYMYRGVSDYLPRGPWDGLHAATVLSTHSQNGLDADRMHESSTV